MAASSLLIVLFALYFQLLVATPLVEQVPPVVDTGYAKYLGSRPYPNTVAYLGIPYAEPPLGDRRWRAAFPLDKHRVSRAANGTIVDATKYGQFCIQGPTNANDKGGAGSEDCLNVDVYVPASANRRSKLPVLVYIHGGAYVYGNPANWPFDHWIQQSPNVIAISVYYRLDSFGFLATPAFNDPKNGDFNVGFMDQIQALRWIQENIKSFGGDPLKVTISGNSAGGASTQLHLVSTKSRSLFSQAIAQSVYRTPLPTPEQQIPLFNFYANAAGCGIGDTNTQLSCLREASVSTLVHAQEAAERASIAYRAFHPVLDGKLFLDYPTKLIQAGKFARVPLIVGATSNETLSGSFGTDFVSALRNFFPSMLPSAIDNIVTVYPISDFESESQRFQAITGESELICARTILGYAYSKHVNTWAYRYNQKVATWGGNGVSHAAENWMMFRGTSTGSNGTTVFQPQSPVEQAFARETIAYWLSFVRSGNPNTFKLPQSPIWTTYNAGSRLRVVLQQDPANTTIISGSRIEEEPEKETYRCGIVASKANDQQN